MERKEARAIARHAATVGTVAAEASLLEDERRRVVVTRTDRPRDRYNPTTYTTVRNGDTNRFMDDDSYWTFMPREVLDDPAVTAALEGLPHQADAHVTARNWHVSIHHGPPSFG